ncbi:hypothetical protein [Adhaeretor mobilis]|uniref:Uncharacterized protein n=1 Tax=Adhaeretor mobilis TaxID=1930276 RepID=A0A517MRG4_9BACT|nr:hypothetical protein [Adhaeretor mobilis]QDS97387.1 hypothetical protein HG15A2_06480 [Adhaeretor mobilis]
MSNNTIRAERDGKYYLRFLLMALGALGFGLWSLYDGMVTYPDQLKRDQMFVQLAKEEEETGESRKQEWEAFAAENGYDPAEKPDAEHLMNPGRIQGQFIMAGVCGLATLGLLAFVLRSRGRWIEGDGTSLNSSWGQSLKFADVFSIDKKKWKNKGIAKVHYKEDGRKKMFVIDDFKFKREPTGDILRQLEANIDKGLIVNGKPEGPKKPKAEEAPK